MSDYQKDQELLNRIRAGNETAKFEAYRIYYPKVVKFLKKYYKLKEDTEDVAQTTFYYFFKNILEDRLIVLTSSLLTYLNSIAKNTYIAEQRKAQSRKSQPLEDSHIEGTQPELINPAQREALLSIVEEMLKNPAIDVKCYKLIYDTYYLKKPHEELAQQLGYNNAHVVGNLKDRCMKKFRKLVIDECKRKGIW